jgi:hypothetical protein
MNEAHERWMPPSPHREAILAALERGRAHLEERGHNLSPLFVYEDGGAMELALMRVIEGRLVAVADAQLPETSTKHVDVCGTIDEIKALLEQQPELADISPEVLLGLLDHALKMLERMDQRLQTYREFARSVDAVSRRMDELEHPDHGPAPGLAAQLRVHLAQGSDHVRAALPQMFDLAEAIRTIAGDSETVLYSYRDLAIELGALYERIREARDWKPKQ